MRGGYATWSDWRIIWDHYVPKLDGLANRYGFQAADRDEIVQNVLVRLYKCGTHIRNFEGLLWRTVRNEIYTFIKKRRKRNPTIRINGEPSFDLEATENPDAEILSEIDEQRIKEIQEGIAEMPPRMAQVFQLRWHLEKSRKQIAAYLGISEDTVKNHLLKAMHRVREHLSKKI